jgi:ABC-type multidrug transport system ATPase subunit
MRPDRGVGRVLGFDVVSQANEVRRRIGLAGQYAAIDENLTGRENLRFVGRLAHLPMPLVRSRADDLLERFDLTDAADRTAKTYSGGMRRRLDLAAALVHRPPVLFLDEPTTGLDPSSRLALWSVLEELVADGMTLLLTTQYLEEADRLSHRVAVVDHGNIIALGTPAELKAGMGATVFTIGFNDPATAHEAATVLSRLRRFQPKVDGNAVILSIDDGAKLVVSALRTLDNAGLEPVTLALREPSLDDVFLTLTGHKAVDAQIDVDASDITTNGDGKRPARRRPATRGAA